MQWGALLVAGSHRHETYGRVDANGQFLTLVPYAGLRYQRERGIWMSHISMTPLLPIAGGRASWPSRAAELSGALGAGFLF